jgi:FkbM family methyltransferase
MDIFEGEQDLISLFLTRYGEWADLEVKFVSEVIADDISVADIGAYLGTFGLGLGMRRRLGQVHFVEANCVVVPLLRSNVERNCRAIFSVSEALVAPRGTKSTSGFSEIGNCGRTVFNSDPPTSDVRILTAPSKCMTLEELRRQHGDFGLVKLDVEGMELGILESDAEHIKAGTTIIWCECNEHTSSLSLASFLLEIQRSVYYFAYPAFNTGNFKGDTAPIFPFAFESGLLAMPDDRKLTFDARSHGCFLIRVDCVEDLRRALWRTPRWAPKEWWSALPEEIVAEATRLIRGETYEKFLK